MIKRILAIILSASLILTLAACGSPSPDSPDGGGTVSTPNNTPQDRGSSNNRDDGALSGTYEGLYRGVTHEITFSGSSVTLVGTYDPLADRADIDSEGDDGVDSDSNKTEEERAAAREAAIQRQIERSRDEYLKFEESNDYEFIDETIDRFNVVWRKYRHTRTGTYSLTDTELELVFADGEIVVHDFTSTENTITLDGTRFTRKQ
jgi:hypothetical protein